MYQTVLTFDHGNSNPHVGVYVADKLTAVYPLQEFLQADQTRFSNAIMIKSSVGKKIDEDVFNLPVVDIKHYWDKNQFLGMPVQYSKSLGDDRLCEAFQIYQQYKNQHSLLLDVGTFITADFISSTGFAGGFIFPGAATFLKSYTQGANLPLLGADQLIFEKSDRLPTSTPEAILKATTVYLSGILSELITKQNIQQIILTGGGADGVEVILKEKTNLPIIKNPTLIHESLYTIYKTIIERGLPL